MDLAKVKQIAHRHQELGWVGMVMMTEEVVALLELLERAGELARRAQLALHDHDLEMVRNLMRQVEEIGTSK